MFDKAFLEALCDNTFDAPLQPRAPTFNLKRTSLIPPESLALPKAIFAGYLLRCLVLHSLRLVGTSPGLVTCLSFDYCYASK